MSGIKDWRESARKELKIAIAGAYHTAETAVPNLIAENAAVMDGSWQSIAMHAHFKFDMSTQVQESYYIIDEYTKLLDMLDDPNFHVWDYEKKKKDIDWKATGFSEIPYPKEVTDLAIDPNPPPYEEVEWEREWRDPNVLKSFDQPWTRRER